MQIEISKRQINKKYLQQIFSEESRMAFYFKKTERFVTAVYLVTSLLDKTEPLKKTLRDNAVKILTIIFSIGHAADRKALEERFADLHRLWCEIYSFLGVSVTAGMVSEMNGGILQREIESILGLNEELISKKMSPKREELLLTPDFFNIKEEIARESRDDKKDKKTVDSSDLEGSKLHEERAAADFLPSVNVKKAPDQLKGRKEAILNLLKNQRNMTLKDFAGFITDCSEKTILRELNVFVGKGMVLRHGARRWSSYSLAVLHETQPQM